MTFLKKKCTNIKYGTISFYSGSKVLSKCQVSNYRSLGSTKLISQPSGLRTRWIKYIDRFYIL